MRRMRICSSCQAAENPKATLKFHAHSDGIFCERCRQPEIVSGGISGLDDLVVIPCPNCRGSGIHGNGACKACVRLGVVRVSKNSIPVYKLNPRNDMLSAQGEST